MKAVLTELEDGQVFLAVPPDFLTALGLREGDYLTAGAKPGLIELRRADIEETRSDH